MIPIAHISLLDIDEAIKELRRVAKLGMKGTFLFSRPINGRPFGNRYYDPFWAEAQDLGMPVSIHVINNPKYVGHHLYPMGEAYVGNSFFFNVMINGVVQLAFTSLFEGAVFEPFSQLKVVVLETGCGWIAHWLDHMDAKYREFENATEMKLPPASILSGSAGSLGSPMRGLFRQ